MQYDYLIFIGRFQPFHPGHLHVAQEALKISKHLIFVIGSHEKARSTRNPYTTDERIQIIRAGLVGSNPSLGDIFLPHSGRVHFVPQHDHTYNDDRWIASIQSGVGAIVHGSGRWTAGPIRIGIIGYDKDHSTYYLKKFPQWEFVQIEPDIDMDATRFRHALYTDMVMGGDWFINETHHDLVLDLCPEHIVDEYQIVSDYKSGWANTPYPVTFTTVDAVVTNAGHLLVVQRLAAPGKGLWALPGGFVNQTETLEEAVLRELYEETNVAVPRAVLKGSIAGLPRVFDDPHRSERGRTITTAYLFKLSESKMPKIRGGDDALEAFWVPFADVVRNRDKFFEDHFAIIENMVGL